MSDLTLTWKMSNEANLFLLQKLTSEGLQAAYGKRTRTVAEQFAHMHAVRIRWLKASAPKLAEGLAPLDKRARLGKRELKRALKQSEGPIARFLEISEESGKVKNWKGPPASFLGYLVAHEAHHRGLVLVALRAAGHRVEQDVVYGLWDWGKKRSNRA